MWTVSDMLGMPMFSVVRRPGPAREPCVPDGQSWGLFEIAGGSHDDAVQAELDRRGIALLGGALEPERFDDEAVLDSDDDASTLAVAAGWPLVRVPDSIGSPYCRWLVVDTPETRRAWLSAEDL